MKMITSTFENGRLEIFVGGEFNFSIDNLTEKQAQERLEHFKFLYQMWN